MSMILAIDPGKSGGLAFWADGGYEAWPMPTTPGDLRALLARIAARGEVVAYVERITGYLAGVRASPKSMFSFGKGIGLLEASLACCGIPMSEVSPVTWQKAVGVGAKAGMGTTEWKNKLKARAQQLYPGIDVTLKTADALLILWWARGQPTHP